MKIFSFNDNEINEVVLENATLEGLGYFWFNFTPEELDEINDSYLKFDRECLEECKSMSQLAKVDFYDNYTFMVLNSLKYENGVVVPDEFNIFLGSNYIVTVSKKEVKIINELQSEFLNYKSCVSFSKGKTPAKLLYYLLDKLILSDYEIMNKLENVADSLEIHIVKNPDKQFLNGFLHLRHQVHTLRRCIAPLRYIGDNLLCNENEIISKEHIRMFHRINSKIDKLIFSLEGLVQYIALVREAFETEMSNKTNELMKLFTIVAMFFSPLSLIAAIYGMNFKMPECGWRYGYYYSLSLMAVISVGLFVYFKKKNWL